MKDEKGNWRIPVEPAKPGAAPPNKPDPEMVKRYYEAILTKDEKESKR